MRIGFIGVGNMGGPMAANLVRGGHRVCAYDLDAGRLAAAGAAGAATGGSALDAADGADLVITMLPESRHVRQLYLDAGLLAALPPTVVAVDCSTIAPSTAREVAAQAASGGIAMLDAPVSGGTRGAERGQLTFMVGGEAATLDRVRGALQCMGANVFHAGGAGAGQMAKLCNNMLLAAQMTATAEALALGVANGLDAATLSAIMRESSGGNWPLNAYNPWPGVMAEAPAAQGYRGGFAVDLMIKDLNLALEAAAAVGVPTALGALARNLYATHRRQHDAGGLDFSSILRLVAPDAEAP